MGFHLAMDTVFCLELDHAKHDLGSDEHMLVLRHHICSAWTWWCVSPFAWWLCMMNLPHVARIGVGKQEIKQFRVLFSLLLQAASFFGGYRVSLKQVNHSWKFEVLETIELYLCFQKETFLRDGWPKKRSIRFLEIFSDPYSANVFGFELPYMYMVWIKNNCKHKGLPPHYFPETPMLTHHANPF